MRLLILEAVSAGLCGDAPPDSLLREGAAMWRALVEDACQVPGVRVTTCLSDAWRERWVVPDDLDCFWSSQPAEWSMWWDVATTEADAALIVAPETDGQLISLTQPRPLSNAMRLNADAASIALCGDKWALARHLEEHALPSPPTELERWQSPPAFPADGIVVKPRDGAGAQGIRRLLSAGEWLAQRRDVGRNPPTAPPTWIRQPWIRGRSVSIAGLFAPERPTQWLPVVEQRLEVQRVVRYHGGVVPARIEPAAADAVRTLAASVAATIPGLAGYIGFDIVLPEADPARPLLIEINPRVTTSYVGYRHGCRPGLMARWLTLACASTEVVQSLTPLCWHGPTIGFTADGVISQEPT
jgi:predicted ATP-grasp superfamily ATP-dependent carboligase